jgi:hypothetical protein
MFGRASESGIAHHPFWDYLTGAIMRSADSNRAERNKGIPDADPLIYLQASNRNK